MPRHLTRPIRRFRRRLPARLTVAVLGLHLFFLLTCLDQRQPLPPDITLFQLLWASAHRPSFYALIALLLVAPPLTYLAFRTPGHHRIVLILTWLISLTLMFTLLAPRLSLMVHILYLQCHL